MIGVVVGLLTAGLAAAHPGAGLRTITVGPKANGTVVRPQVGDTLVVRLPGNATTGYRWAVVGAPSVLRPLSSAYVVASPGRLGQGGTYVFRFRVRSGSGLLRLDYRRPWEKGTPPLRTFRLTIRTRGT
jgi:inhibitor of cysteine peptidase